MEYTTISLSSAYGGNKGAAEENKAGAPASEEQQAPAGSVLYGEGHGEAVRTETQDTVGVVVGKSDARSGSAQDSVVHGYHASAAAGAANTASTPGTLPYGNNTGYAAGGNGRNAQEMPPYGNNTGYAAGGSAGNTQQTPPPYGFNAGYDAGAGNYSSGGNGGARTVNTQSAVMHGFTAEDVAENKIVAMAAYLLGVVGIIIALLGGKDSDYASFHVRQALKLSVSMAVLVILAIPFALLSMIPYLGVIFEIVLVLIAAAVVVVLVLRLIAFVQVCCGMAQEPYIIRNLRIF